MNLFLITFYYFIISIAIVGVGLYVFELVTTKYKDWEEIESGNKAIALSVGGKIIGICVILAFAIYHSNIIMDTVIWGLYGVVLQIAAYFIFDFLTRRFTVGEQLKNGNIAVGIVSFCVSVGLAFVVGASIT
ncbi:DUF350 domain-containing protein [Caldalkalibacillus salinus]|uniref:DUF350 domain-containing protein n=1 Tax=Caldalkalibacillus salinus TaxID=2803787 RepID=UPI0019241FA2|nr:DUF350 domain-containing protein [Caldalkalibacillus salinus]